MKIYTYGLMVSIGFVLAYLGLRRLAAREGIAEGHVNNVAVIAAGAGFLGARLAAVAGKWSYYGARPSRILQIADGGVVFHGGLVAALAALLAYFAYTGLDRAAWFDRLARFAPLTHAFGRLGCLGAGCCYGAPTTVPWAVTFARTDALATALPRHPTQLYEAAFLLVLYVCLGRLAERKPPTGTVALAYVYAYGVFRFLNEMLRGDDAGASVLGPLRPAQEVFLVVLPVTLVLHLWLRRRRRRGAAS